MSEHGSEDVSSIRMVTTPVPAAALVPKPPTASCEGVHGWANASSAASAAAAAFSAAAAAAFAAVSAFRAERAAAWAALAALVTAGEVELVHPASINVMATAAITTSLRTVLIGSRWQSLGYPPAASIGRVPERATQYGPAVDGVDEIERVR